MIAHSPDYCENLFKPRNNTPTSVGSAFCHTKTGESPPGIYDYSTSDQLFEPSGLDDNFAQVVFEAKSFSPETLWSLCEYEIIVSQLLCEAGLHNHDTCLYDSYKEKNCCFAWHLGSLAADMFGHKHCRYLTRSDSQRFWNAVKFCSPFTQEILGCRKKPAEMNSCLASLPKKCRKPLMFTIFFNLIERNLNVFNRYSMILPDSHYSSYHWRFPLRNNSDWVENSFKTVMFLPIQKGGEYAANGSSLINSIISASKHLDLAEYYKADQLLNISRMPTSSSISHEFLEVVGMDFGVRFQLFQWFLLKVGFAQIWSVN